FLFYSTFSLTSMSPLDLSSLPLHDALPISDWIAFLKQWYRRDTSINHRFGEALASRTIGRISPHIGYLYNRPTHDRPAGSRVFAGWHRKYALKSSQSFRAQTPAAGKLHYLAIKSNHERKLTIT